MIKRIKKDDVLMEYTRGGWSGVLPGIDAEIFNAMQEAAERRAAEDVARQDVGQADEAA